MCATTENACRSGPIGIIFHYKTQHIAISGTEIVINKSKQRTGIGEVAVMEMMVVECVAVVTGVIAHKCAPAVVAGKEARFLARSICQPVFKRLAQAAAALLKQSLLAHFACECHI